MSVSVPVDSHELRILAEFGIAPSALLGEGSEARVYALDTERVLRVMGPISDPAAFEREAEALGALLAGFAGVSIGVQTPRWLDGGGEGGWSWRVEARMPGASLTAALAGLEEKTARHDLLLDYLEVATRIAELPAPTTTWAQALQPDQSYPTLAALLDHQLDRGDQAGLASVGIDGAAERARLRGELGERRCRPAFVHADYFPDNVFAVPPGAEGPARISGVGDFSVHDLVADPFMTWVGAVIFVALVDYPHAAVDAAWLQAHALATLDDEGRYWFDVYRRWYALYYSMDPAIAWWWGRQLQGSLGTSPPADG